jgi:hypothetical protein
MMVQFSEASSCTAVTFNMAHYFLGILWNFHLFCNALSSLLVPYNWEFWCLSILVSLFAFSLSVSVVYLMKFNHPYKGRTFLLSCKVFFINFHRWVIPVNENRSTFHTMCLITQRKCTMSETIVAMKVSIRSPKTKCCHVRSFLYTCVISICTGKV